MAPTPSWIVDATLSPDFSQVESDELQVTSNLRFAPFLPERRPFFLERSDLFSTPINVAYTRSILDPDFGLRATGRRGRNTFSLLTARDAGTLLTFPGSLGVERLLLEDLESQVTIASARRELGRAKVALLATDRRYEGGRNSMLSLDSKIPLDKTWNLELQAIASRTHYPGDIAERFDQPDDAFNGLGGWARLEHEGRRWTHRYTFEVLGDQLRADAGFLQRVDYQRLTVTEWWHNWVESDRLRDHGIFLEGFVTRSGGRTQDWELWLGADWTFRKETNLDIGWITGEDTVSSGGLLPYGRALVFFSSTPARWLSFSGRASYGTAIDYTLEREADLFSIRFAPQIELFDRLIISAVSQLYELSDGPLLQRQTTHDLRAELQITRRFGLRQIVQQDEALFPDPGYRERGLAERARTTTFQTLLRYWLNYATVAYLGFYDSREKTSGSSDRQDRGAFLKLSYLWR